MRYYRGLLLAIQFLTRLPTPQLKSINAADIGLSQYFYPLTGFVIGLILAAISLLSTSLLPVSPLSDLLTAALVLAGWVLLTGALHLDGLADSADAWVGGYGNREKTLEIMKDPRSGPVAVSFVVISLLLKLTALALVIEQNLLIALVFSPVIARLMAVILLRITPYSRPGGIGEALNQHQNSGLLWINIILVIAIMLAITGFKLLVISVSAIITTILIRQLAMKRLGGITGDISGAQIELVEIVVIVAFLLS